MSNELDMTELTLHPAYLRAEPDFGVVVCTEHRTAYTPTNINNHLVSSHKASQSVRHRLHDYVRAQKVSTSVREPPHGSAPIPGLQTYVGWQCNFVHCGYLSQSREVVGKHCSKVHGLSSKRRREANNAVVEVSIQKWFAKSNKYWVVSHSLASRPPSTPRHPHNSTPRPSVFASSPLQLTSPSPTECNPFPPSPSPLPSPASTNVLINTSRRIQQAEQNTRRIFQTAEHPAELTPWMRESRYYLHFKDIDMARIPPALLIPRQIADHVQLFYVAHSVHRVLTAASRQTYDLHIIAAKRLNSFEVNRVSQDPFTFLQEASSLETYISTFQRAVCYLFRVVEEDHFEQPMFVTTPTQQSAMQDVGDAVGELTQYLADGDEAPSESDSEDPEERRLESRVDAAILRLLVALIQHRTVDNPFDSVIMSFCAAASWSPTNHTWMTENQSGPILSRMIYCCQLIILAESHRTATDSDDFHERLRLFCQTWMTNDVFGPLGDMLRLRLYAMSVAKDVVHPAQIRWRSDNETLMYQDLTYRISDLATEIAFCLEQAQLILHRDLCLDLPDIPTFDLTQLEDNWDDKGPGQSFLTDVRNGSMVDVYHDWLFEQIAARPVLYSMVVQHDHDNSTDGDQIRSTFAHEYEAAIQRFLGYMSVLLHKGSGQPARSNEFLSLRWQNKWSGGVTRNLFVHDGYVLFILTYHKALHRSHASRYPVRFLLPEVGQLLVQYLVVILPLRQVLSQAVQIPAKVSEYLWHDGEKIWTGDRFMRFARSISQQAHGVAVNMASWRQIAVAIAVKRFGGTNYQADLDIPGDPEDDLAGKSILDSWGGAMADVFHLQAAHSVSVGNRIYGGSVNFERGLTDAALQEYFKASRLWHQLCRPSTLQQQAGHRRQASRQPTTSFNAPLRQRLEYRDRPSRHRLRWGSDQVQYAMRQLFSHTSTVHFRSEHQEQLIDAIVSGCSEVIGVLATGEGKSLAFLLPSCLPRAGLTVVVVPLVALKTDMVRRCEEANIAYAVWDRAADSQQFIGTPLLFVSVEQAVRRRFQSFLGQLDAIEKLDRVVFDEAHLILTAASYRPNMALVRRLRQLYCQVVFLTATLPPLMQPQFEARMLLNDPRVVRSRTFRSDISYRLRHSKDDNLLGYVTQTVRGMLQHHADDPTARLLVYTPTRQAADDLSHALACPKYYSDSGDAEEKMAAMQVWRLGVSKVLVATSAFGMGVDFPSVRHVVHMGHPTDMIGFAQEVGRLSRDGQGGFSRVILPRGWDSPGLPSVVDQARSAVSEMAMLVYLGENRCLSAVLSRFLDGPDHMIYCRHEDPRFRCTKCVEHGLFNAAIETDHTVWWDHGSGRGQPSDPSEEDDHDHSLSPSTTSSLPTGAEGNQRHRASAREIARRRDQYELGLQLLRGRCMICMILGHNLIGPAEQIHPLHRCRHPQRHAFTQAKQEAIHRNQSRDGWMKPYVACFRCGQPQDICAVDPDRPPTEACAYSDMVFPATWAMFHAGSCWGRRVGEISGTPSRIWQDEGRWMDWLGTECDLYGMRASQAARMMDQVIHMELADVVPPQTVGFSSGETRIPVNTQILA